MADLTPIVPRLAKLLPLLGSDQPGEVAATAAAIGRLLSSVGASWHDLAGRLATPATGMPAAEAWRAPPRSSRATAPRPRRYRVFTGLDPKQARQGIDVILATSADLTVAEKTRLSAIRNQLYQSPHRRLTSEDERWLTTRWEWHATETAA